MISENKSLPLRDQAGIIAQPRPTPRWSGPSYPGYGDVSVGVGVGVDGAVSVGEGVAVGVLVNVLVGEGVCDGEGVGV